MLHRYIASLLKDLPDRGRRQLLFDLVSGTLQGIISTHVLFIFGILIANDVFQCSSNQKTLIVGGTFLGMGVTLWYESLATRYFSTRNAQAALPGVVAAIGSITAAAAQDPTWFVCGCMMMGFAQAIAAPAFSAIWHLNYPTGMRAQLASLSFSLRTVAAILSCALGGLWLDLSVHNFRSLFVFFAIVAIGASICALCMPRVDLPAASAGTRNGALELLKSNQTVQKILIAWFVAGLAMHTILVQKTEYLSNPGFGLGLSKAQVALYASVLTEGARLIAIPIFARAFDNLGFITVRLTTNLLFLFFTVLYFHSVSLPAIALASVLHGIGQGGGMPLWSLWTTKYVPSDQTGSLMAIHTVLTGVRGILGPWLGYQLVAISSIQMTANFSLLLQGLALVMFLRLRGASSEQEQRVRNAEEAVA